MIEASHRFIELEPDSALRPSFETTIAMLEREQKSPTRTVRQRKGRLAKRTKKTSGPSKPKPQTRRASKA
jgi:hypothetical protein